MTYRIAMNHTAENGPKIIEQAISSRHLARQQLRQYTADWGYVDGTMLKTPDHVAFFSKGWAVAMYIEPE